MKNQSVVEYMIEIGSIKARRDSLRGSRQR